MKLIYVMVFFLMVSCELFTAKKTTSEAILNGELKTFNWNDVDEYPAFMTCRGEKSKQLKKNCFQSVLTAHILKGLQSKSISVSKAVNDTIMINFVISEVGKLRLKSIGVNEVLNEEIPEIDKYVLESLKTLPAILPAIKRGQRVKTEFKLPLIIKVE